MRWYVSARKALITSGVIWCDIDHVYLYNWLDLFYIYDTFVVDKVDACDLSNLVSYKGEWMNA